MGNSGFGTLLSDYSLGDDVPGGWEETGYEEGAYNYQETRFLCQSQSKRKGWCKRIHWILKFGLPMKKLAQHLAQEGKAQGGW